MTRRPIPRAGRWATVRLPDGRPAKVTTRFEGGRRLVIVKPIKEGVRP